MVAIHHLGKGWAGLVPFPQTVIRCDTLIEVYFEVVGAVMAGVDADFFERWAQADAPHPGLEPALNTSNRSPAAARKIPSACGCARVPVQRMRTFGLGIIKDLINCLSS